MLTDAQIVKALKSGKNAQLSDGSRTTAGRLILIIRSGRAEWYAQQWLNGKKRLSKIGTYPQLTLLMARQRFQDDYADPLLRKADIRIVRTAKQGTVDDLFKGYIEHLRKLGKRTAEQANKDLQLVLKHIDPRTLARDVTTDSIVEVLRPVYARGAPGRADHIRAYVRSAFTWGIRADSDYRTDEPKRFLIASNPASAIPPEPKKAGNRFLSVDELRAYWRWLQDTSPYNARSGHGMAQSNLMCLRMIILTGQRVEQLSMLQRSQVKGELLEWERTKSNPQPHLLPMPRQAMPIIEDRLATNHEWIFPSLFNPSVHVRKEVLQDITKRFCRREGVDRFTPRDLRRTWKTLAGFAGISKTDRDLIQVHSHADISSRHYDRYEYLPEKQAAMKRWSEWFADSIEV